MLTVIIHKKSSQQFIDKYHPLFEPYLETRKIAFCFWDEHGTDIHSAVPELTGIVRGVRRWKAIIVDPLTDELEIPAEPSRRENPFDFLCNSDPEPEVHESHIPIIRLAQMLGGVPLVNRHYDNVMVRDESQGRIGYAIKRREQEEDLARQQEVWDRLNDQYSFNCEYPTHLYLFSARNMSEIQLPTVTDMEQLMRHESDNSLFWYRNRYPAKARFLVQDCTKPGHAHYRKDLFSFWMTVLTLAINDAPPGTFEAYKLYQVISDVDLEKIHTVFSTYYNRLSGAQFSAKKQILELQKEIQFSRELDELPIYEREIPVSFKLDDDEDMFIKSGRIGLAGDCPTKEEPWWLGAVEKSRIAVMKEYRSIRRVLDTASIQCRYNSQVIPEEIYELDEYQYEEMNEQLIELERELLTFNTYRVLPIHLINRELERTKKSALTSMKKRMTSNLTIGVGLFTMLVYLVGFIPDLLIQYSRDAYPGTVFLICLLGLAIIFLVSMGCLFHFRQVIRAKIGDYNGIVNKFRAAMKEAAQLFSDYLSKCCSYMRGKCMLQTLDSKAMVSQDSIRMYGSHIERLKIQLDIIKSWLEDFELGVLPDKAGVFERSDFDFEIPPDKNREYLIQLDNFNLHIPCDDGSVGTAPYPFVTAFHTNRVPLFEQKEQGMTDRDMPGPNDYRKGTQ